MLLARVCNEIVYFCRNGSKALTSSNLASVTGGYLTVDTNLSISLIQHQPRCLWVICKNNPHFVDYSLYVGYCICRLVLDDNVSQKSV